MRYCLPSQRTVNSMTGMPLCLGTGASADPHLCQVLGLASCKYVHHVFFLQVADVNVLRGPTKAGLAKCSASDDSMCAVEGAAC